MDEIKVTKIAEGRYQVDMRGWMCPYPKYAVEAILRKMPPQATMDFLVDCPAATTDVPKVVKFNGFQVDEVSPLNDGEWKITISR